MADSSERPYKRRHYFINRRLQGRFTVYFLILGLFITMSTSMLIWHFSAKEFDRFIYRSHISPVTPWEVVFPVLIWAVGVSVAVLVISAYLFAHLIFKGISERLSSFNNALRDIGEGNLVLPDLDDRIREVNEPLRLFIEKMKADIASLQATQKAMRDLVGKMAMTGEWAMHLKDMEGLSKAFGGKLSDCFIRRKDKC